MMWPRVVSHLSVLWELSDSKLPIKKAEGSGSSKKKKNRLFRWKLNSHSLLNFLPTDHKLIDKNMLPRNKEDNIKCYKCHMNILFSHGFKLVLSTIPHRVGFTLGLFFHINFNLLKFKHQLRFVPSSLNKNMHLDSNQSELSMSRCSLPLITP